MLRVTSTWSGFPGAPGFTNFYFDGIVEGALLPAQLRQKVADFWNVVADRLPSAVQIVVEPAVSQINPQTGILEDEIATENVLAPLNGRVGGPFVAPAGVVINWKTGTLVAGRRLRGKTFLVPLGNTAYQDDGTLTPNTVIEMRAAAQGLAGNVPGPEVFPSLVVWHRPVNKQGGSVGVVIAAQVTDKAAILTSRRD
jgi:hypothetical protein